jgi:hypothetical protein
VDEFTDGQIIGIKIGIKIAKIYNKNKYNKKIELN